MRSARKKWDARSGQSCGTQVMWNAHCSPRYNDTGGPPAYSRRYADHQNGVHLSMISEPKNWGGKLLVSINCLENFEMLLLSCILYLGLYTTRLCPNKCMGKAILPPPPHFQRWVRGLPLSLCSNITVFCRTSMMCFHCISSGADPGGGGQGGLGPPPHKKISPQTIYGSTIVRRGSRGQRGPCPPYKILDPPMKLDLSIL